MGLSPADLAVRIGRKENYLRSVLTGHIPLSRWPVRAALVEVLGLYTPMNPA